MAININKEAKSGVTTLSESVLRELSLSYPGRPVNIYSAATRINKSLPSANYAKHQLLGEEQKFASIMRPGESIARHPELLHIRRDRIISIHDDSGAEVRYRGWINPTHHGLDIIETVQDTLDDAIINSVAECTRLAAIASIGISTAHIFTDGSGRTAVGVADVLLRRMLNKKLNLPAIESDNKLLEELWMNATCAVLPFGMRLKSSMDIAMGMPDKLLEVDIIPEGKIDYGRQFQFESELADNVCQAIGDFDLDSLDKSQADKYEFTYYAGKLSEFFQKRLMSA